LNNFGKIQEEKREKKEKMKEEVVSDKPSLISLHVLPRVEGGVAVLPMPLRKLAFLKRA
jgi:hypothetical protein